MHLAHQLRDIEPSICTSRWSGHEHFRGYGVMVLPFSSGHLLGLRVFPQNDFAPYHSVWHCTPGGRWTIYNDGPSLETTCPRWWGPALEHAELNKIRVRWTGPNDLRIEMDQPRFRWTLTMKETPLLRMLNPLSASMPLSTWRKKSTLRMREWMAKNIFGMGNLKFSFTTPSGHQAIIMPQRNYFIRHSEASLEGHDLGIPIRLNNNPYIGDVPLPTRPVFIIGQAHAKIKDPEEYKKSRELYQQNIRDHHDPV